MKTSFDNEGYFTGNYAIVGNVPNGIDVESLPEESDILKRKCYKYKDGEWTFDEERYQILLSEQQSEELITLKQQMIEQSKNNLKRFLKTYKLKSTCHGGIEQQYSITEEKQSHLASMILTATMAAQAGIPYQPSWNAAGEACTYDWTLLELQQLAMEMEAAVRPLVSRQQSLEVEIKSTETLEELEDIDITFERGSEDVGQDS